MQLSALFFGFTLLSCILLILTGYLMPLLRWARLTSPKPPPPPGLKVILFWTPFFNFTDYNFGTGRQPFINAKCPEDRCFVSTDRNMFETEDWDALIFHHWDMSKWDFPWRRSAHQRYVYYNREAPPVAPGSLEKFNNIFNWTMTYRYDSDIPRPYGWVSEKQHVLKTSLTQVKKWRVQSVYKGPDVAARKTKLAAWFVSKCVSDSRREVVAEELEKYVHIDVYGRCGSMSCPSSNYWKCLDMLNDTYKFYLAFENSFCRDYVTEKFFNILKFDVVPVVYGGADYSRIAPPGSYVDANKFPSAQELAEYLLMLDGNDTLYNQYFWWRKFYEVTGTAKDNPMRDQGFCQLCQMLHEHSADQRSSYGDIQYWWNSPGTCKDGSGS